MRTSIKVVVVVLVSAAAGYLGTSAICARGFQDPQLTAPEHRQDVQDDTHMRIALNPLNFGDAGVLEVRAKFEVVVPETHPIAPDVAELDVFLAIKDEDGKLVVPLIKIDHVQDRKGVGHWFKDLNWATPLERGTYSVGVYVGKEGQLPENTDGELAYAFLCECRTMMTVD